MIKKFLAFACMAIAMFAFSSCLNSDEDEITYYDDTAVTAFSLSAANRYIHTTASDGVTDSVYKTTLTVTGYSFSIDQQQRLIYNTDSLPLGTDAAHILATISSKNSGTIVLNLKNKAGKDSLAYYSSTDSIDFTNPVRIRVYNGGGTAYREYTVKVNIHQQEGDIFKWNTLDVPAFQNITERRLLCKGEDLYLFGLKDGATVGYVYRNLTWTQLSRSFGKDAYKNVVVQQDNLYLLDGESLLCSSDGEQWQTVATMSGVKQLLGASPARLYALTDTGIIYSTDQGATWTADALDDDAAYLPASDLNFVCSAAVTNDNTYNLLLIGNLDGKTMTWAKVEENASGSQSQPWYLFSEDEYNLKVLPSLSHLQVVNCEGTLLAIGGDLKTIYSSLDQGLTWSADTTYTLPAVLTGTGASSAMTVGQRGMIYLSTSSSPTLYYGRLTRYGWADN